MFARDRKRLFEILMPGPVLVIEDEPDFLLQIAHEFHFTSFAIGSEQSTDYTEKNLCNLWMSLRNYRPLIATAFILSVSTPVLCVDV